MATLTEEGRELRLRLCAHLRRLFAEHGFPKRERMAEKLGMDAGHFSALYNGKTDIGLDVAVKMHRVFGESLNHLCDDDPDAQWYPPGKHPGYHVRSGAPPGTHVVHEHAAPYSASPSAAQPGKRRDRGAEQVTKHRK